MDGTKNRKVTRVAPLEIEINRHKKQLKATVTDLNRTDMFLGHNWVVKHNPEVNWKNGIIQFIRCPGSCKMKHQDIKFRTRRTQATENKEQNNGEIGKESDTTNTEDLLEYIHSFTYLFNKKKFKKLPEQQEWDSGINIIEEAPKELNIKAYTMMVKEKEALNQWLNE